VENLEQIFTPESSSFWNLLLAVTVLIASFLAARMVRRRFRAAMNQSEIDESAVSLVARVSGWVVVFLGVVLALSIMGVDMVPVVLLIILVVAFLFFSGKSMVENWAAGLLLQARGLYKLGDRIDTNDYSGDVRETNARTVIITTGDGQIVHIPNVDVLTNPIVNRTGDEGRRRSSLTIGVGNHSDFDEVARILVAAATATSGVSLEPTAPVAWISSVGETTVSMELRFWHEYSERNVVRSAVTTRALSALTEAGVSLPFPTREVIVSGAFDT
jgi:small conductance mechanosensitive channel